MDNLSRDRIFNAGTGDFVAMALALYQRQHRLCPIFNQWINNRGKTGLASSPEECCFLPISFFKTHEVSCLKDATPQITFTSSGTTGAQTSRHHVYDLSWYENTFVQGWHYFFPSAETTAFFCLLPSYMERSGSSLIYMMEKLVALNHRQMGGFYLHHTEAMVGDMQKAAASAQHVVLLGVSFALLDFAEQHPTRINAMVMETGGMKGRKEEITREELHLKLCRAFGVNSIASEYGMTELMSQAYAKNNGRFYCPPWMRVMVRDESDPGRILNIGQGLLCIIDLANWDSCAFIETQDVGKVYDDGGFEVMGRVDHADMRGCNLLIA